MGFTAFLDVVIGLVVLYLGASLFVTILMEYIAQLFKWRTVTLRRSLSALLGDKLLVDLANTLPALKNVMNSKIGSYVDQDSLAAAVIGHIRVNPGNSAGAGALAAPGATTQSATAIPSTAVATVSDMDKITAAISAWNGPDGVKAALYAISQTAGTDVKAFTAKVSDWLDRSLSGLGESYKKKVQNWTIVIAVIFAIASNMDTIHIADRIYKDKELRDQLVAIAEESTKNVTPEAFEKCMSMAGAERKKDASCAGIENLVDKVMRPGSRAAEIPIGWTDAGSKNCWLRVLGWLMTALAVSLGAPFWFDLLNKIINVRHAMRKPE